MSYSPIAKIIPQYENYPNWWLKAFEQGTTTPLSMATDAAAATLASKFELNSYGFIRTAGGANVIPYIDVAYDLWLFPTAAEADANDTSSAIMMADNIDNTPSIDLSNGANVLDYGAIGDGVKDDSEAIQAACNAAGVLGKVLFPKASVEYVYGATINMPAGQTWQGEVDYASTRTPTSGLSVLRYTGSSIAVSGAELQWINIILQGNVDSTVTPNAGIGLQASGNVRLFRSTVRGFTTGCDMTAAFYHLFDGCTFFQNNNPLQFAGIYNANILGCKFQHFDDAITGSGGTGMLAISNSAFENWTGYCSKHLFGSVFAVSYDQCYWENYPDQLLKAGMTDLGATGYYDLAFVTTHGRAVTITNSLISTKGMKRVITGTADNTTRMESNNVILFAAGASIPNETEYLVKLTGNAPTLFSMKDSYQFVDSTNTTQDTAALAGIATTQVGITLAAGTSEYEYLDYLGNLIHNGQRVINISAGRTLTIADQDKTLRMLVGADANMTVPSLPAGFVCYVIQDDANVTTFVKDAGLTTLGVTDGKELTLSKRYGIAKITSKSTTSVNLSGDLDLSSEVTAIQAETGTTYTTVLADANKTVTLTNASPITCTIPPNASVAYPIGTVIEFAQTGAGAATLAAGAGVTLNTEIGLTLNAQWAKATALKTDTDVWLVTGNLKA